MIGELVLHLGDTKTGSTSIQRALLQGLCRAPGKTLLYPTANNHIALAKTLTQKRRFGEREARFGRLRDVFRDSDADIGIVSAEHFQFVDPQTLKDAIDTYWPELRDRIRLVAYVRPHADKVLSTYAERVKLGVVLDSIEEFFAEKGEPGVFEYAPRFGRWRAVFGDRFHLRLFRRDALFRGDAVADFLRFAFGSEDFEILRPVAANASLTVGQLALLRAAHAAIKERLGARSGMKFKEGQGSIGRILAEHLRDSALGRDSDKLRLPAPLAGRIRARYAADAAALDAAFFEGTPMSDALAGAGAGTVPAPQSLEAADYFPAETVEAARVFAAALGDVLANSPQELKQAVTKARSGMDAA